MPRQPFQSTLPARGATLAKLCRLRQCAYFNPRSPHGERPLSKRGFYPFNDFNPRSPHGERPGLLMNNIRYKIFQSTLPARGATSHIYAHFPLGNDFNPRSPHGERRRGHKHHRQRRNFNPRSPHGERRAAAMRTGKHTLFQSTLPARGATKRWKGARRRG